jgi:heme o synthase
MSDGPALLVKPKPRPPSRSVAAASEFSKGSVEPRVVARSVAADLLELTKPRIVVMILITAAVAMVVAAGRSFNRMDLLHLLIGTALIAGSAGAMNQWLERSIDGRMARTRYRPLPGGRISSMMGLIFGLVLGAIGFGYLAAKGATMPLVVGAATWLVYVVAYTPMKQWTSFNTTVGAVSGALPMLMGWTAGQGSLADPIGWLLFGVLFCWQYPHFMALAWMYRYQYGLAGFQMTPVVEPSGKSAAIQAIAGAVALPIVAVAIIVMQGYAWWWLIPAVAVCLPLIRRSILFARQRDDLTARLLLRSSLIQLPAIMLVLVIAAAIRA